MRDIPLFLIILLGGFSFPIQAFISFDDFYEYLKSSVWHIQKEQKSVSFDKK
jgi:hypothetical protein